MSSPSIHPTDAMASDLATDETKTYDCLIFVKGLPEDLIVHDADWGIGNINKESEYVLVNLGDYDCHFESFRRGEPTGKVMVFISRVETQTRDQAIDVSFERLDSLLDCYSMITEAPPKISELILVREENQENVQLFHVKREGFARLHSKEAKQDQWHTRNHTLLNELLQYLDIASTYSTGNTELTKDLFYALRMYRQGSASQSHNLEFLAKFSALECLVCGSQRIDRGDLLQQRLFQLLESEGFYDKKIGQKLYDLRCVGSHQARTSRRTNDDPQMPAGVAVIYIEHIFSCVLFFFLENLRASSNSNEMWSKAGLFSLPEIIVKHLPEGISQMAVRRLTINPKREVTKIGSWFDAYFAHIRRTNKGSKV